MKLFYMISSVMLLAGLKSNGQNTFPATGNVGIGTTTPVAGLSVEAGPNAAMAPLTSVPNGSAWIGSASTNGGLSLGQFSGTYGYIQSRNKGSASGAYKLALNPLGGFVGVGTTAPASALHVIDANATLLILERNAGATNMNIQYKNSVNSIFAGLNSNGGFSIGTTANFSNGSILTATADGNVGIGTTTPAEKLSITGGNLLISNATWYSSKNTSGTTVSLLGLASDNNMYMGDLFGNNSAGNLILRTNGNDKMTINSNGNISIGTNDSKGYKFAVNGSAIATSVTVKAAGTWPDYVFKKDYQLPSLQEVKTYIDQNQHLPEIPSAQEIAKDGLDLGEMNKLLMKKVEELTLYLIEKDQNETKQTKMIEALELGLKRQQQQIDELKSKSNLQEQIKSSIKH